jgi:hypothetical protein
MEKLWTDEVIIETVWKTFMTKLLAEWEDVILWVRRHVSTATWPYFILTRLSTIQVHRDVDGECGLSRHSWRSHIQSQRECHSERKSSIHLSLFFSNCQLSFGGS